MTDAADFGAEAGWIVVHVRPPARGEELLLIDALRRVGARVVRREGERYAAYFPAGRDPASIADEAAFAIRASTTLRDPDTGWRPASSGELEALWAGDVAPRRVTERIVVAPAGMEPPLEEGADLVVRLLPGVGFGTAQHPTTRSCLRMLQERVEPGARLADVGAGTGILAIAAALLGAGRVLALEADALACEAAHRNIELNQVGDRVEIRRLEAGPGDLAGLGPFDGIVANVEAGTLIRLLPDFRLALAPGGWLILSGAAGDEPPHLVRAARAHELALQATIDDSGWWTACLTPDP